MDSPYTPFIHKHYIVLGTVSCNQSSTIADGLIYRPQKITPGGPHGACLTSK